MLRSNGRARDSDWADEDSAGYNSVHRRRWNEQSNERYWGGGIRLIAKSPETPHIGRAIPQLVGAMAIEKPSGAASQSNGTLSAHSASA